VTAVKGSTVWRGCGPPVVKIGDEVVPHSDWLSEVTAADVVTGRQSSAWLSSHFVCQAGHMAGEVAVASSAYGGGLWKYTCCCSALCNAGFKCVQGALGSTLEEESSDVAYHEECPEESTGCYSIKASGDATGWKVIDEKNYLLAAIADPRITATVKFETSSGRPPDLGEEMIGFEPKPRVSTDSWPSAGTSVQFIDTADAATFPYEAVVKAWVIYARSPGTLRLLVWRKSPEGTNKYTLVGTNTVHIVTNFKQAATFLSNSSGGEILVQPGDMLGWAHAGPGVLEYEELPGEERRMRFIYGASNVGDTADFTLPAARRYSIRAFYDPTPNSTSPLNSAPLPTARGCYQQQLGRFGLRRPPTNSLSLSLPPPTGALGASVQIAGANANVTSQVPDTNVILFKGVLHTFSCCSGSMCNQKYCSHPSLACGWYPPVDNAKVTPRETVLMMRQRVRISCNTGYQPSEREERKLTPACLANGSFSAGEICLPRLCGNYSAPADGKVWPRRGLSYGEFVNISCNPGFQLEGLGTAGPQCLADGTFELGRICAPSDYSLMVFVAVGVVLANVFLAAAFVWCAMRCRARVRARIAVGEASRDLVSPFTATDEDDKHGHGRLARRAYAIVCPCLVPLPKDVWDA